MSSAAINLSQLPPPEVIEPLSYEIILAQQKSDLISRYPECEPLLALESEPLVKQLEVCSYRELLLRQRVNESCRSLLLALSGGANLDHIGVTYYHSPRLLISAGNMAAVPPIADVMETDDNYRTRLAMAPEGYSVAGPSGAYEFLARSASGLVKDAQAVSPWPGQVDVYILSQLGDGTPSAELLATVEAALMPVDVRPMCDTVTVKAAIIKHYQVGAAIYIYDRPAADLVLSASNAGLAAYSAKNHRLGYDITTSGLNASLFVPGAQRVQLNQPTVDVVCGIGEAAYCSAVNVVIGGLAQ